MSETRRPSETAPASSIRRGLFPDYPDAAIAYWIALALAGAAALVYAGISLSALPASKIGQALTMAVIAAMVGAFPLRIPKSKHSIAAGDVFIFLLLLVHGAAAATIAAAAESGVIAWRTSKRWTSWIASPAAAACAMLVCGSAFDAAVAAAARAGIENDAVTFCMLMAFAIGYFLVSPTIVTAVIYLKRRRWPTPVEWLTSFGWSGLSYLGSASVAGVLYLAYRQFGIEAVVFAAPMIALFLTTLHYYFAQQEATEREAAERASRERAEAAQREAAQAAQHLRELEQSDRRFHGAFTDAAIGMALVRGDGHVAQVNRAMCALLGRDRETIVGADFRSFVEPADADAFDRQLRRLGSGASERLQLELRYRHADGREVWASMHGSAFANGTATESHLILQAFDITARRHAEGRLHHLAYHDSLTNLANRSGLLEALAQAITANRSDPLHQFSVMHLNFDRFKLLNDSLGHGAGDLFLVKVAQRLKEHVRPNDVLARLSGDEFALLTLHHGRGTHHALAQAERLQEAFRAPIVIDDSQINTGISIGITFSDIDYRSADDALRDAALAMSKARAGGNARYAVFDSSLHEQATQRLQIETDLRRALDADQLSLAFQPVFELASRRLVGFEALTRWEHPERGSIAPSSFIPVAEESELIGALTQRAIQRACLHLHAWRDSFPGHRNLFVNVNISGYDLGEPKFADQVRETLAQYGLPPSRLTLEITENTLMQQLDRGSKTLARLRELGVGLSVDDFGTGYSSLSHLSTLPINSLKIDRSFVDRLEGDSDDWEIVRAVIQLGDALGISVIAEGIETEAQLDRLCRFGCKYGQGYYLARPLTARQVEALLAESSRTEPAPIAADYSAAAARAIRLPRRAQA